MYSNFELGKKLITSSNITTKIAKARPELCQSLQGKLVLSKNDWVLLEVPNAIGNGAFSALNEPGAEQPVSSHRKQYYAHISVIRPEEWKKITNQDKHNSLGKSFSFNLGPARVIKNPAGWADVQKCWIIDVTSSDLDELRKSLGLGKPKYPYHITFAVKTKNKRNKSASLYELFDELIPNTLIKSSSIHGRGLFANADFKSGSVIVPQLMEEFSDIVPRFEQSKEARYTNHSDFPNTYIIKKGKYVKLMAAQDIPAHSELTVDYNKSTDTLGNNFYYTYQGEPYGNFGLDNLLKKLSSDSHYVNAFNQIPFTWNSNQSLSDNLFNYAALVKSRGDQNVAESEGYHRLQNSLDPDKAVTTFLENLKGRGKVIDNPLDQIIQGIGT